LLVFVGSLIHMSILLSTGMQDLYPDFRKVELGIPAPTVAEVAMLYNVGAVLGAILFGHFSERIGRRYAMLAALGLSLAVLPFWAFGGSLVLLAGGALLLRVGAPRRGGAT